MKVLAADRPDAHRARRVRARPRRDERGAGADRLDAAAIHHHRVRVRGDEHLVARTARRMDRARPVRRARTWSGSEFLDRFEARYGRRPEYFFPLYCYDVGRLMMLAIGAMPVR